MASLFNVSEEPYPGYRILSLSPHLRHSTFSAERGSGPKKSAWNSWLALGRTYTPWNHGLTFHSCDKRTYPRAELDLCYVRICSVCKECLVQSRTRWPILESAVSKILVVHQDNNLLITIVALDNSTFTVFLLLLGAELESVSQLVTWERKLTWASVDSSRT